MLTDATISAYGSPQPPLAQQKSKRVSAWNPSFPTDRNILDSLDASSFSSSSPLQPCSYPLFPFYCWVFSFLFVVRSTKYSLFSGVQNIGGEPPEVLNNSRSSPLHVPIISLPYPSFFFSLFRASCTSFRLSSMSSGIPPWRATASATTTATTPFNGHGKSRICSIMEIIGVEDDTN